MPRIGAITAIARSACRVQMRASVTAQRRTCMLRTATYTRSFSAASAASATPAAAAASASAASKRPFRILGLQQIALGGLDKAALSSLWVDLLGLKRTHSFVSEKENVDEDILVLGSGAHAVEVDLMQPLDANKAPKVHIPALNHIGLWVDDLRACVAHLEAQGMRFTPGGIRKGASGFDVCFLHPKGSADKPKSGEGVLIELVQAPQEVIDAHKQ